MKLCGHGELLKYLEKSWKYCAEGVGTLPSFYTNKGPKDLAAFVPDLLLCSANNIVFLTLFI